MTTTTTRRAVRAEFRATEPDKRRFEAVVMAYNVVDDYGTMWQPGVFTESLSKKLPKIVWAHDWSDPLGRYVDYRDNTETLTLVGEFDDFDAVPKARRAYAQLQSGTIDEFSVGFVRREWNTTDQLTDEQRTAGAQELMIRADLAEASLVLVGAVPGTELVGVRGIRMPNGQTVPEDFVIDLGKKLAAGAITRAEAVAAIDLVAGSDNTDTGDSGGPDVDAALAEAQATLELLDL